VQVYKAPSDLLLYQKIFECAWNVKLISPSCNIRILIIEIYII